MRELFWVVGTLVSCSDAVLRSIHPPAREGANFAPACRDRNIWPFAASSIWNTPIGSLAQYTPAQIYPPQPAPPPGTDYCNIAPPLRHLHGCQGWNSSWGGKECVQGGCCYKEVNPDPDGVPWCYGKSGEPTIEPGVFYIDTDHYVVTTKMDPLTPFVNQGWWGVDSKCATDHCCTAANSKITGTLPFPSNYTTNLKGSNNAAAVLMPDGETLVQFQPLYRCTAGGPVFGLDFFFVQPLHIKHSLSPSTRCLAGIV